MEIPPFAPEIKQDIDGTFIYDDGRMLGSVEVWESEGKKGIRIDEWSSHYPGYGHSTEALRWLRERFDVIAANGIGEINDDPEALGVGDIATMYWLHMRSKGLVDLLYLNNGEELRDDYKLQDTSAPNP